MKLIRLSLAAVVALTIPYSAVFAAGGGDGSSSNANQCNKGFVYDKKQKKCVRADESSLNDADLLDNGRALAYAGRFDEALVVLNLIHDQQIPEVQNYLGFSSRKAGNVEKGLSYYRAALALNPDYTLARSYMGQALLNKGDRSGAVIQLYEIEKRVGRDAREYKLLAASLENHALTGTTVY